MKQSAFAIRLCIISWCVILLGVLLDQICRWAGLDFSWLLSQMPPCVFRTYLGLYCPGCGGTRAILALLAGHPLESFRYHPVVLYGTALYGWYLITNTIQWITKDKLPVAVRYHAWFGIGAVVLTLGNWVLRNILLLVFHITM